MNDISTNYRIQRETNIEESIENDSLILVKNEENKKSKYKKCLENCLIFAKKALVLNFADSPLLGTAGSHFLYESSNNSAKS